MPSSCPKCGWPQVEGARCPRCGVDVARYRDEMASVTGGAPAPGPAPAPVLTAAPVVSTRPAGFWIRVVATAIDGVCVMAGELAFALVVWLFLDDRLVTVAGRAFRFVAGICYPVIFHWLWGQTLGKMAVRVRVVTLDGGPLTLGRAIVRQIGYWISAVMLGIGYLVAAFRGDKRALHDLIAGTRVEHLA
ncbi:MAG TPA: RDD family protein [Methylomirabilota bacterium]|nr:RDD family protein [Methylomirabilota bacterium]